MPEFVPERRRNNTYGPNLIPEMHFRPPSDSMELENLYDYVDQETSSETPDNHYNEPDNIYDYIVDQDSIRMSQNQVYSTSLSTEFQAEDGMHHGDNSTSKTLDEHFRPPSENIGIEGLNDIQMSRNEVYGMSLSIATSMATEAESRMESITDEQGSPHGYLVNDQEAVYESVN